MKKIITFPLLFLLFACSTSSEKIVNYTDQELCVGYLTRPSANIWIPKFEQEISKRKLDCKPYIPIANMRMQQDNARKANLQRGLILLGKGMRGESATSSDIQKEQTTDERLVYQYDEIVNSNRVCYYKTSIGGTRTISVYKNQMCPRY